MDNNNTYVNCIGITVGENPTACISVPAGRGCSLYLHGSYDEIRAFAAAIIDRANSSEPRPAVEVAA